MEKTKYEQRLVIETISVLPRTLEIETQQMKKGDVNADMFVVYGKDPADRKVWVATFVDVDEAQCFVQSSKTFGRPVLGAVVGGPEVTSEKGGEMSDDATTVAVGDVAGSESTGQAS
jgi:hypothetical protein